jgi:hypothetical protein
MSISKETSPQENHIFKPAQTPTYVDTNEIQEGGWRAVFATVRKINIESENTLSLGSARSTMYPGLPQAVAASG